MTEKELRKLSRAELLELLLEQSKEMEKLKMELKEADEKLDDQALSVQEAGSIAEAALRINKVFETAQKAADQYLENIKQQNENIQIRCKMMEDATRAKCDRMVHEAEEKSDAYWQNARKNLEEFIDRQAGLRDALSQLLSKGKI